MEKLLITAIALAIPTYFYIWLVRSIDRFEKEPAQYLICAFMWGAVPAILIAAVLQLMFAVPVEALLGPDSLSGELIQTAIGAPVTEEILKGVAVAYIYLQHRREFDGWVDGIVYGAMVGLGFAYVEDILYLMDTATWGEWGALLVTRSIVFGAMHGFWSALTGIGFGLARYMKNPLQKISIVSGGLVAAIAAHLIHNAAVTLVEVTVGFSLLVALLNYGVLALILLILWFVAAAVDRKRLKLYLKDEVPDILSVQCYEALCNPSKRTFSNLGMTAKQQRQFIQTAAELAQKKLQLSKMGEEGGNSTEIAQLRAALKQQSLEA